MTDTPRSSLADLQTVRFSKTAQFESISNTFIAGDAQIVILAMPTDVARLAVAFLLGLTTGGRGELERLTDGSYLVVPAGWPELSDRRVGLAA